MTIKPDDRQDSKDDPIKDDAARPRRGSQSETNRHSEGPADPHEDDNNEENDDR